MQNFTVRLTSYSRTVIHIFPVGFFFRGGLRFGWTSSVWQDIEPQEDSLYRGNGQ